MKNFQLYRTNILLGGQMKWDLILESDNNELFIKDFHLTPISDNIPYNYKNEDELLNYNHHENIKKYYNDNSGYFYQNIINPELSDDWPMYSNSLIYNDTTDMGCKRPRNYNIYKKQFEFFVPLWLEHLNTDEENLVFEISIYNPSKYTLPENYFYPQILKDELENIKDEESKLNLIKTYQDEIDKNKREYEYNRKIISRILNFNLKNISYHDRFVKYFNTYINQVLGKDGDENLININLDDDYANINGIDLLTGKIKNAKDYSIVHNLLYRERPLMENDDMITQLFKNNKMIAKQLFNFNFCFNIEDILGNTLMKQFYGSSFEIKVTAKIRNIKNNNDTSLELMDFYTNYEYIPKKLLNGPLDLTDISKDEITKAPNVLTYLSDNKSLSLINKNKIITNTIHWSLLGNNDYVFNLYDGFSPYYLYKDSKNKIAIDNLTHLYDDTPNINKYNYDKRANNISWINYLLNITVDDTQAIILNIKNYAYRNFTKLQSGWVKKLYFDAGNIKPVWMYLGITDENKFNAINSQFKNNIIEFIKDEKGQTMASFIPLHFKSDNDDEENAIIFFTKNQIPCLDKFTFKQFLQNIKNFHSDNSNITAIFENIKNIMVKLKSVPVIVFNNSLNITKADSPDKINSEEISYIKNNNCPILYIERYDGKLKPTFVNNSLMNDVNFNYFYYKKNDIINIQKYNNSGYKPLYPSLNYFSIEKDKDANYDKPLLKYINGEFPEYKWFNNGSNIALIPSMILKFNIEFIEDEMNAKDLDKMIKESIINKFKKIYNIESDENDILVEYIYNCYNYKIIFDYEVKHDPEKDYNKLVYEYFYKINTILK